MSWGGSESSGESSSDHNFKQSGVVYFASSGDSPGVIYPSSSPYVVSAGGTQVNRSGGNYTNQTAWSDGGGGASRYESRPSYQNSIRASSAASAARQTFRSTPVADRRSRSTTPIATAAGAGLRNQRSVAVSGGHHQRRGTVQDQQQRGKYPDLQQHGIHLVLHRHHFGKLRHA